MPLMMQQNRKGKDVRVNTLNPKFYEYVANFYASEVGSYEESQIFGEIINSYKYVFKKGKGDLCKAQIMLFFREVARRDEEYREKMFELFSGTERTNRFYPIFVRKIVEFDGGKENHNSSTNAERN